MGLQVIILDEMKHLFKDDPSYRQFVNLIRQKTHGGISPIMHQKQLIGCLVDRDLTKDVMYSITQEKLRETPGLEEKVMERIKRRRKRD